MESFAVLISCLLATVVYTAPPYAFVSDPKEINVLEGDNAVIVCAVQGKPEFIPMLWLNQSFVFAINGDMFETRDRVKLIKSKDGNRDVFSLTISNIELLDEGVFECQIPGRFKLRQKHSLIVNIPPEITSDRNAKSSFDLEIGDEVTLECPATGKPDPVVTWRRVDTMPIQGQYAVEGETLVLSNVTEFENGKYICIASNGFGQDQTRDFTVNVNFAPKVKTLSNWVHTGPGHSVRLECTFSGNPSVQIIWQYQGEDINVNDYRVAMTTMRSEKAMNTWISTLDIEDVQEQQLGEYTCMGSNTLGTASESITLSALPHNLLITSDSRGIYSDQYTLKWVFSSKPDPIECIIALSQLNLTEDGLYRFVPMGNTTVPAKMSGREVHPQESIITGLQENMTYTAKLQCRNEHGSTDATDEFEFQTSEDVNLAPPSPLPEEEEDLETILSTLPRNRDEEENDFEDNEVGETKYEEPKEGASRGKGSTAKPAAAILLATSVIYLMC